MHPRTSIGPLSPIGHPLSPAPPLLSSSASVSMSSLKSRRRSSTTSRRVVGTPGKLSSLHLQCSVCLESLDPRAFARPQRAKEQGATCRTCVWKTLSRHCSQDGSPGLTSSSSSLSSYSEGPTHSGSLLLPTSTPLCRSHSNDDNDNNDDVDQEAQETNPTVEPPLPV